MTEQANSDIHRIREKILSEPDVILEDRTPGRKAAVAKKVLS